MFRRTLLGIVLFISGVPVYAMSFSQAQKVYAALVVSQFPGGAPTLVLDPSVYPNAESSYFKIAITKGMLTFVRNNNEMAMILGHELAHYALGHNGSNHANEYSADMLGAKYMSASGYNLCSGAMVIFRFNDEASKSHPASAERYRRLTTGVCS